MENLLEILVGKIPLSLLELIVLHIEDEDEREKLIILLNNHISKL